MRDDFYSSIYDEVVGQLGNPSKGESEQAFIERVVAGMGSGAIPRQAVSKDVMEARLIYKDKIEPLRDRRSKSLKKSIQYLIDSLMYGEDGANIDPLLSQSFRVGDGSDKLLRAWTPEDYRSTAMGREDNAAKAVEEADQFGSASEEFISIMEARGARDTGSLFDGHGMSERVA